MVFLVDFYIKKHALPSPMTMRIVIREKIRNEKVIYGDNAKEKAPSPF
jgi:hypothetical protein